MVQADARLSTEEHSVNVEEMLQKVQGALRVVEQRRSDNHCRHLGLTVEECAA